MKTKISRILLKAEYNVRKILGGGIHAIFIIIWDVLWIPAAIKMAVSASYYSECKRKPVVQRLFENIVWVLKYHRANTFYTLYGLDRKGVSGKGYIDEKGFWRGLDRINYNKGNSSQVCLLRDKFLFYKYMRANNCPVPDVFGILKDGQLYDENMNRKCLEELSEEMDYFIKDIDGECASFVKHVKNFTELESIMNQIANGTYILQKPIKQALEMDEINATAINTLRIITVNTSGNPKVFSALLRVGTKDTGNVDNWAKGGLAIGINENGYLNKFGFYKPGYGLKVDKHPDSKIIFEEFKVPMLEDAFRKACEAHKYFYGIGAIGWDVAITENGPVFVEGNDNFEITLMQACNKPLKAEWKQVSERV